MLGHTTEPFYSSQPLPQWDGGGDKMTKECPILLNYQELLRSIQVTLPCPLTSIQGIEPHKRWRTGRGVGGGLSPQHDPWEGVKQRGGRAVNTAVPQKQPGRATVPSKAGLLWHLKTTHYLLKLLLPRSWDLPTLDAMPSALWYSPSHPRFPERTGT